jgi:hypothetical protein
MRAKTAVPLKMLVLELHLNFERPTIVCMQSSHEEKRCMS